MNIKKEDIKWNEIEILNLETGRPFISIDKLKEKIGLENLESIDISLSHIKEYAIANAVATFRE